MRIAFVLGTLFAARFFHILQPALHHCGHVWFISIFWNKSITVTVKSTIHPYALWIYGNSFHSGHTYTQATVTGNIHNTHQSASIVHRKFVASVAFVPNRWCALATKCAHKQIKIPAAPPLIAQYLFEGFSILSWSIFWLAFFCFAFVQCSEVIQLRVEAFRIDSAQCRQLSFHFNPKLLSPISRPLFGYHSPSTLSFSRNFFEDMLKHAI